MAKPHSEFVLSILDLLAPIGGVEARRMFGGCGFYREGLMFGLEAFDKFFLKVDEITKPKYEALGLEAFTYTYPDGRFLVIKYHVPPEEAFSSPMRMRPWALEAIETAKRADKKPKKSKRPAAKKARQS